MDRPSFMLVVIGGAAAFVAFVAGVLSADEPASAEDTRIVDVSRAEADARPEDHAIGGSDAAPRSSSVDPARARR